MQDFYIAPKKPRRLFLKIVALSIVLLVLAGGAVFVYGYSKINTPRTQSSHLQAFTVEPGETLAHIAARLQDQGLISSQLMFRLYGSLSGKGGSIQTGTFSLDSSMSAAQILDELSSSRGAANVRVTLPEGETVAQEGARLERAGVVSAVDFKAAVENFTGAAQYDFLASKPVQHSLEGFLFPDTYDFRKAENADAVVAIMLKDFDRRLTATLRADIAASGKSIYQIVTLAAIVEAEVGRTGRGGTALTADELAQLSTERRDVASVFYNRLSAGMPLQSDATVRYATGGTSSVTQDDLKIDSPYNTYKYAGLPPGPINNPSLDSIEAAIYPANTDYLYFLSKPDGTAVFAKTLDEHNANKAKYLK